MIYVLYHGNCFDGMGAYFAAWTKLGDEATYIAADYGRPTPQMEEGSTVYLLDFSYSRTIIKTLALVHKRIIVLDHHKTAEADLKDLNTENIEVIFDMERSGCVIAWEYFHPDDPVPELLLNIQDRDLWLFKLPDSKVIGAGLRTVPFDIQDWDILVELEEKGIAYLIERGDTVNLFENVLIDKFLLETMWGKIGGYVVPIINISTTFSEATTALLNHNKDALFAAYFYVRKDGAVQFGLRSKGDFDVSEIAKNYGGGGHKNASGFVKDIGTLAIILSKTQI